ncbi:MAG: hypothetical protein HY553_11600 [Elusimicrobia bacterium]|nr:hypothetical protein [Elusimicrobiota bacterium]
MRRTGLLVALLAFSLLGLLVGWWLAPRLSPPAPDDRASAPPPPPKEEPLSFEELARLLGREQDDPAARAFAREFAAKPRLRTLWNRFVERAAQSRARRQAGPTARDFLRDLTAERDFAALFASASREAGFRALAERLASRPGLGVSVREAAAAAKAAAGEGKVYGLYAVEPGEGNAPGGQGPAAGGAAASRPGVEAAGARGRGDPRIEGHWVQPGSGPDFLDICRRLGPGGQCERALAECRKDAECGRRVSAYGERFAGGAAGAAASTDTARGQPTPSPSPRPTP